MPVDLTHGGPRAPQDPKNHLRSRRAMTVAPILPRIRPINGISTEKKASYGSDSGENRCNVLRDGADSGVPGRPGPSGQHLHRPRSTAWRAATKANLPLDPRLLTTLCCRHPLLAPNQIQTKHSENKMRLPLKSSNHDASSKKVLETWSNDRHSTATESRLTQRGAR